MIQAPDLTPHSEEGRCDEEEGQDPTNDDVDLGSNPREDSFALARKVDHAPPEKNTFLFPDDLYSGKSRLLCLSVDN